ncbi:MULTISPECIES: Fic family protein [unclassified Nocardioides]|uniref:Fic family protein n=1 Tax=unclassified Nocardioides TaxID=2615069 RepID=UPI0009E7F958|nr:MULTISPECIES: Fic family protein [unclassified Nocardioides]
MPVPITPHATAVEPWRQNVRGGTIDDRTLREVRVSLPPPIADLDLQVPPALAADAENALRHLAVLDATHGRELASLSTLLLRAESVASSKIEQVEASMDDYARALHGNRSNASATSMVASTRALDDLISSVTDGSPILLDRILRAHGVLMADDPSEAPYAGRLRDMQNWIGGSDHSPRGAWYVPPPARLVEPGLRDLLTFANRDDVPVLTQAAVSHAQFESIHPFTDGNGRIGRALINTVLRRRRATSRIVVPLASAIVVRRQDYFDALGAYRAGDVAPLLASFTRGTTIAALESATTAERLVALPPLWEERAGYPRRGSATARLLENLLDVPVLSADDAQTHLGGAASSTYAAIGRLHETGIIRPLTTRSRNQVWIAADVADELEDLGVRIGAAAVDSLRP